MFALVSCMFCLWCCISLEFLLLTHDILTYLDSLRWTLEATLCLFPLFSSHFPFLDPVLTLHTAGLWCQSSSAMCVRVACVCTQQHDTHKVSLADWARGAAGWKHQLLPLSPHFPLSPSLWLLSSPPLYPPVLLLDLSTTFLTSPTLSSSSPPLLLSCFSFPTRYASFLPRFFSFSAQFIVVYL